MSRIKGVKLMAERISWRRELPERTTSQEVVNDPVVKIAEIAKKGSDADRARVERIVQRVRTQGPIVDDINA